MKFAVMLSCVCISSIWLAIVGVMSGIATPCLPKKKKKLKCIECYGSLQYSVHTIDHDQRNIFRKIYAKKSS